MVKRKSKLRLMDVVNLVWSSVHDFLYLGVAGLAYWLWRQPAPTRDFYLIAVVVVAVFVINAIVNYRQHGKLEDRLEKLEHLHASDANAHRAATKHDRGD